MNTMGVLIWNILTPKFYVALTASSFFISILILLFEWWYFNRYSISFLEQFSLNYLTPLLGTNNGAGSDNSDDESNIENRHSILECKVWKNSMSLFRGSEYKQFTLATNKDPLTFYDMNLTAQDHQNFFTHDSDASKEDLKIMSTAWRERDPEIRIKSAHSALEKNPDCATAYILLAEEEAQTIKDAESLLSVALKSAESQYKKSQATFHQNSSHEAIYRRDMNVLVYIRRRLAMCTRKLGKIREAVKMFRDIIKDFPLQLINSFNIHENLIEALLELRAYTEVQTVLLRYDGNSKENLDDFQSIRFLFETVDINLPKSATICYTSALLKARAIGEKFSPDAVIKRGLSLTEMHAVEAICRAVEFNPHVPKYLLEMKSLIFPPEHFLKRGDSEAISYVFFHLHHWKEVDGALNLLECTWKSTFNMIPYPLEKGHLFYPYPTCTESTDRELLPDFHELSVYPPKSYPFFIRFTASLSIITASTALITYQYPDFMFQFGRLLINTTFDAMMYFVDKFDLFLPTWLYQQFVTNY